MKAFRFRLASVLKVREHEFDLCKRALEAAQTDLLRADSADASARMAVAEAERLSRERLVRGISGGELRTQQRNLIGLRAAQTSAAVEREERQAQVERARTAVSEAWKQVRMLEKLREKKRGEHRVELERAEQALQDEMGLRVVQGQEGIA